MRLNTHTAQIQLITMQRRLNSEAGVRIFLAVLLSGSACLILTLVLTLYSSTAGMFKLPIVSP
jgi:hypothetical protein